MFVNDDANRKKTERLKHRDSSERLLACLEGIDDDLIAEAANAIDKDKQRRSRLQWFNIGNAAAVFVGAIAISCVLMLAYWISTAEPTEAPAYNGTNGDITAYTTPIPSPSPQPDNELVPGGILPVPRIQATGFEVILPAYQPYMYANNPWHDIGHIDSLPVFRNHAVTRNVNVQPPWSSFALVDTPEMQMTDEEWDQFVSMIYEMGHAIAIASRVAPDRIATEPQVDDIFVSVIIDGYRSIASKQIGTLSLNTNLSQAYREIILLPPGASLANDASAREVQVAIDSLVAQLSAVIPMESPTITNAQGLLDIGGPMTFHRQRFFDAGGSAEDAILSFNFKWVEVLTFDPHHPERIEIALFPHEHFESLQLGHYPIITADQAREMLLDGYFVSDVPDTMWPGRERALAASVELVYYSPIFSDAEVIMPFYRFLIETDMPQWWTAELSRHPGEYKAFFRYYVPAVHRDYLEPMTRRHVIEPPEAPTGTRALPPNVFRRSQLIGEMWSPMRVERQEVADLWAEVLYEIGELAVDEAYQFRTACGLYAMITGSRMLTGRDELRQYFPKWGWDEEPQASYRYTPGFDLPEAVGDFRLREISVFDQQKDMMFIFDRPMPPFENVFVNMDMWATEEPAPVGEIFHREPITFSIFGMYENREGVQVGLGITLPIMGLHFLSEDEDPHSVLDMGEYGNIYFQGYPGEYLRALHESRDPRLGLVLELWFVNGSISGRHLTWDLGYRTWHENPGGFYGAHWFTPVEREALEELVRIFNPAALAREYNWDLIPLQ